LTPTEEILEKVRWRWDNDPLCLLLGIRVADLSEGYARLALQVRGELLNLGDEILHGGVLSTMVDLAAAVALHTILDPWDPYAAGQATVEMNINFIRAVTGGEVFAEGRILRKGRSIAVGDVDVRDEKGELVAKGRATYMILKRV
jgi:uncharacterized protein (TIGR00369 family)